jgi:hypothetical protein
VITSDHGEMIFERGQMIGHGGPMYEPLAHIPLMIRYPPAVGPVRVERFSEAVDVMPTMLSLLGVSLPAGRRADGRDLTSQMMGETVTEAGTGSVFASKMVRGERFKCLFLDSPNVLLAAEAPAVGTLRGELYDLETDPSELINLWDERPQDIERCLGEYRAKLSGHYRRYVAARTSEAPQGDFAIAATHFEVDPPVEAAEANGESRWVHSRHWQEYSLRALPRAQSRTVRFPIPSSEYVLSAYVQGDFDLQIGTADPIAVSVGIPGVVELGRIVVSDGEFVAQFLPSGSAFEVRHFGFRPVAKGEQPEEEDAERAEQLKSLGYIN